MAEEFNKINLVTYYMARHHLIRSGVPVVGESRFVFAVMILYCNRRLYYWLTCLHNTSVFVRKYGHSQSQITLYKIQENAVSSTYRQTRRSKLSLQHLQKLVVKKRSIKVGAIVTQVCLCFCGVISIFGIVRKRFFEMALWGKAKPFNHLVNRRGVSSPFGAVQ
jgi:hypothetical protein